jgi:signal transduction histidine kinase
MKVALSLFRGALAHQQLEETTRLVHHRIGLKPTHLARLSRKDLIAFLERSRRVDTIGSLASGIAHDFNNVLSTILLAVGDGQIGKHDPAVVEESLGRIQSAAVRARGLVGRILDFARTGDDAQSKSDLGREVREALKLSKGMLKGKALLHMDLSDEPIHVGLPPAVVHQIVLNLVTNAVNALIDGGRIAVEMHITPENDVVVLTVSDTGVGMSQEVQSKIFEPFFSGKEGGTGLGLAVVHAAVTDYGGRIEVESEPGVGTSISVYLPTIGRYPIRTEDIISS